MKQEHRSLARQRRHPLARHVDEQRVRAAIQRAEERTTGKIHTTLSHHCRGDILACAMRVFRRLRLGDTPHRNGVLFYIVPSRREFAVIGDTAIHEKVGQGFWDRMATAMSEEIKNSDLTSALVLGIGAAGDQLALHFPRAASR